MYLFSHVIKLVVFSLSCAYNNVGSKSSQLLKPERKMPMKSLSLHQYPDNKKMLYNLVNLQLKGLIDQVPHKIANLANASALLGQALKDINWVGFYLLEDNQLILGPFRANQPVSKFLWAMVSVVLLS